MLILEIRKIFSILNGEPEEFAFDQDNFITVAKQHALLGLLYRALQNYSSAPVKLIAACKQQYSINRLNALHKIKFLADLQQALMQRHVPMFSIKGALLAEFMYGDMGLRESVDLDILIPAETVLIAHEVFKNLGLQTDFIGITQPQYHPLIFAMGKDITYYCSKRNLQIDVHWRLEYKPNNLRFDFNQLWKIRQTIILSSGEIFYTLPPIEEWLFLCMHASRHAWKKLQWLCDIVNYLPMLQKKATPAEIKKKIIHYHAQKHVQLALKLCELGFPHALLPPHKLPKKLLYQVALREINQIIEHPIKRRIKLKLYDWMISHGCKNKLFVLFNPVRERFLKVWIQKKLPARLFFLCYPYYFLNLFLIFFRLRKRAS